MKRKNCLGAVVLLCLVFSGCGGSSAERSESLFEEGCRIFYSKGDQDWDRAFDCLKRATRLGHQGAKYLLADCYFYGNGVAQDKSRAFALAAEALSQKDEKSRKSLCRAMMCGEEGVLDAEFVSMVKQEYESGAKGVEIVLVTCYATGQVLPRDMKAAMELAWTLSEEEYSGVELLARACGLVAAEECRQRGEEPTNAKIQFSLGLKHRLGIGVAKDDFEAAKWFRKSAEQGELNALSAFLKMYEEGAVGEVDPVEVLKWLHVAVESDQIGAQYLLGCIYRDGLLGAKDAVEAVKWFRKAAENGDEHAHFAQCDLAIMYATGDGIGKDAAEAAKWYHKSAEQGNAVAQYNLALMYVRGEGVEKDATQAAMWCRKAAEQHLAVAEKFLGDMYEFGLGVERSDVEAKKWHERGRVSSDGAR